MTFCFQIISRKYAHASSWVSQPGDETRREVSPDDYRSRIEEKMSEENMSVFVLSMQSM